MEILLLICAFACIVIGILGCVVPVLPGLPISYVGLLLLHWSSRVEFELDFLILWAFIVVGITLLDFFIPMWGAKRFGGSQRGVWGATLGMVVGMFFPPLGLLIAPFLGAVLGELTHNENTKNALKAGLGTFIGFLTGIIAKLVVGGFILYYAIQAIC